MPSRRLVSVTIYVLASAIGLWAFASPFFAHALAQGGELQAGSGPASLLLVGLVGLCYLALLHEAHGPAAGASTVALLGVLVALNAALRFAETVVPGPGGFTPMFLLIMLGGYVFGARVGFLLGALSMLVSALVTGGVGPWLPYQMWAAGWVGAAARLVRPAARALRAEGRPAEVALLAAAGAVAGFGYGALINLWFWPYLAGDSGQSWRAGLGLGEGAARYLAFYAVTSLWWDSFAAAGNAGLIVIFGAPALRALRRYQARLSFRHLAPLPPPAAAEERPAL